MTCISSQHTMHDVLAKILADREQVKGYLAQQYPGELPEPVAGYLDGDVDWLIAQVAMISDGGRHHGSADRLAAALRYVDDLAATFTGFDEPDRVHELLARMSERITAALHGGRPAAVAGQQD